ncbi:hypothetical protein ABG067_000635 [Albugo candida]
MVRKTRTLHPQPIFDQRLLPSFLDQNKFKSVHAQAIWRDLTNNINHNFHEIPNLPLRLQQSLHEKFTVFTLSLSENQTSEDGTIKLLFKTQDGHEQTVQSESGWYRREDSYHIADFVKKESATNRRRNLCRLTSSHENNQWRTEKHLEVLPGIEAPSKSIKSKNARSKNEDWIVQQRVVYSDQDENFMALRVEKREEGGFCYRTDTDFQKFVSKVYGDISVPVGSSNELTSRIRITMGFFFEFTWRNALEKKCHVAPAQH